MGVGGQHYAQAALCPGERSPGTHQSQYSDLNFVLFITISYIRCTIYNFKKKTFTDNNFSVPAHLGMNDLNERSLVAVGVSTLEFTFAFKFATSA
jgi:hypothetical protein